MLPQTLSRNIIRHGGCNMLKRVIMTLNVALLTMSAYVVGVYVGENRPQYSVDTVAIEYAVYQAMKGQ